MERFRLVSAVHLFLMRDDRVLLLRRFNTGYEDGNYSVIAGHLEGDEEVRTAAIREAREEVGIEISPQDLQLVGVMHRKSDDERIDFFVAATSWSGEIANREPERCDQLLWCDLDALPVNVIPYVRRALHNARRGVSLDHNVLPPDCQVQRQGGEPGGPPRASVIYRVWFDSFGWE